MGQCKSKEYEKKTTKAGFFLNQKNKKYSEEYIEKLNRANQKEHKSTAKCTCTSKKKRKRLFEKKRAEENDKNAESFTK